MLQDWTMYIYRTDRRCRSGERLFSVTVWQGRDELGICREAAELAALYPSAGWRFEWFPTMRTVRNLMTGADVSIPHDTPRACDPSSELYWSM